jgi:putative two-component system response regulator
MPQQLERELPSNGNTSRLGERTAMSRLDFFLQNSLIHREDWAALATEVRGRLEGLDSDRSLLKSLLELKLLTQYQVDRIEAGTTQGLLLGSYRILSRLGAGGMGVVFLAEHILLRRLVAIKVLPMSAGDDPCGVLLSRFFNEIRMVAQLQHPNIVWAIDTGEFVAHGVESQVLYYHVMEYVPGQSLEEMIHESGPFSMLLACDTIYQVASALAEADKHRLVHRDIKPSNILVTPEGQAKLLDFGLARTMDNRQTQPGVLLGTIDYMAPEQFADASAVDIRADIYSLGGTLYWCLTGKVPFPLDIDHSKRGSVGAIGPNRQPPALRALRPDLPAALDEVVAKMMANKASDRYPTPLAVMKALLPFLTGSSGDLCNFSAGNGRAAVRSEGSPTEPSCHRVLLVDDEPAMRTISRTVLEAQGILCDEVGDGRAALKATRSRHYDLLLIDVEMPGMPGTELLRQLRDDPPNSNLKIIMTSGRVSSDEMSSMILSGADDFIAKPFSVVQLIARTKAAIRLKTAQDRSDCLTRQALSTNKALETNLASKESDLVHTRNTLVLTLAELIAGRGAETPAHLQRMAGYVRAFAQELLTVPGFASQVDENFILSFEGAAPLHDIGMIGVPEHILLKPSKLDPEESLVMQSHTTQGAEILQKLAFRNGIAAGFLQTAIDVTRHHHERWDGRGYPDRLAGSDIPLSARIVGLVDVYDAIRAKRPHKPALPHIAAVQMMTEASPGQFDPALLRTFEKTHQLFEKVFRQMPD